MVICDCFKYSVPVRDRHYGTGFDSIFRLEIAIGLKTNAKTDRINLHDKCPRWGHYFF
jgi:hypothetical protein